MRYCGPLTCSACNAHFPEFWYSTASPPTCPACGAAQSAPMTAPHDDGAGVGRVYVTPIRYFGCDVVLACDGNCAKAWGIQFRPRVQLSVNEDDYEYLADGELGAAPADPGTYEGDEAKPTDPLGMNKWCARQCERSVMVAWGMPVILPDLATRQRNIPA